jgi:hypothetical protein
MINAVAGQPALAMECIGTLLDKFELPGRTFGDIFPVETKQVPVLNTAM